MISEVLVENGYNTYCVGKWHLTPENESNMAGSRRTWPLGRGFERYYGFLGGETNQWYPDLVHDNHAVDQPYSPEEGYHLSKDLVDQSIQYIQDGVQVAPDKPWLMYLSFGANHAPHHAPKEWIDKYKGKFDDGYEAYRVEDPHAAEEARHRPEVDGAHRAQPVAGSRRRGSRSTRCGRGIRSPTTRRGSSPAWPRCTPASRATPTTSSDACSTTSRPPGSSTTRSSSSAPTTGRAARAARTARSTRTSSSTAGPTTSRRTSPSSTSSADRAPTTTIRPAGRSRSTLPTRCSSATRSRAASPIR